MDVGKGRTMNRKHLLWWIFDWLTRESPETLARMLAALWRKRHKPYCSLFAIMAVSVSGVACGFRGYNVTADLIRMVVLGFIASFFGLACSASLYAGEAKKAITCLSIGICVILYAVINGASCN